MSFPKRNRKAEAEREISRLWYSRPDAERIPEQVEDFGCETHRHGPRLADNLNTHIQLVRGLLGIWGSVSRDRNFTPPPRPAR